MNEHLGKSDRDDVLFAFHQACEVPTVADIVEWSERYPEFASDIRDHAAILLDIAADRDQVDELDDRMYSRARSRAMNALYNARERELAGQNTTFADLVKDAGQTIPSLARAIPIDRMVIAELAAGRMRLPLGKRIITALLHVLRVQRDALDDAIENTLATRRLGQAKAIGAPSVLTRSYEEVIQASAMSDEDKAHWLDED